MNREMRRASKKIGKQMMSLPPNEFEEISYSEIQKTTVGIKPDQAWRNIVQDFSSLKQVVV